MAILIDGYNLLNASGVFGRGRGPGTLERSRGALLRFLAATLTPEECARTTVVFDAAAAPYNLPRELEYEGITVRFAPRDRDADTVIEELICSDSAPRRLTVVSSDHRIQKAAHRRRAQEVDSDVWWAELVRRRRERHSGNVSATAKPEGPLSAAEVEHWLKEFGEELADGPQESETTDDAQTGTREGDSPLRRDGSGQSPAEELGPSSTNPFPPGYGEDIREEDV